MDRYYGFCWQVGRQLVVRVQCESERRGLWSSQGSHPRPPVNTYLLSDLIAVVLLCGPPSVALRRLILISIRFTCHIPLNSIQQTLSMASIPPRPKPWESSSPVAGPSKSAASQPSAFDTAIQTSTSNSVSNAPALPEKPTGLGSSAGELQIKPIVGLEKVADGDTAYGGYSSSMQPYSQRYNGNYGMSPYNNMSGYGSYGGYGAMGGMNRFGGGYGGYNYGMGGYGVGGMGGPGEVRITVRIVFYMLTKCIGIPYPRIFTPSFHRPSFCSSRIPCYSIHFTGSTGRVHILGHPFILFRHGWGGRSARLS